MEMAAHLDRPVAPRRHRQKHGFPTNVQSHCTFAHLHSSGRGARGSAVFNVFKGGEVGGREERAVQRQAEVAVLGAHRVVHSDELRAVAEGALDLHLGEHGRHSRLHLPVSQHAFPHRAQLRHAELPFPDHLQELVGNEGLSLRAGEPQPPGQAPLGEEPRVAQGQLVLLPGHQPHASSFCSSARQSPDTHRCSDPDGPIGRWAHLAERRWLGAGGRRGRRGLRLRLCAPRRRRTQARASAWNSHRPRPGGRWI
mmetsp:Transcript_10760/g.30226  ORF Transcript_10760/g.30226 Transcript_10760/m.30226 type:complete len:254 (+) Transcript_10760:2109-2870(+)